MKVNSTAFLLFSEPHPVLDVLADFADRNPFLLHGMVSSVSKSTQMLKGVPISS